MEKNEKEDKRIMRAAVTPAPETEEGYDFECVAVPSENGQIRYSYENDEYFMQVLDVQPESIDVARMESGLPLFDNHPWENSAQNTLGITVGYEFTERGLVARVKYGARADEALRSDIKNGILKTVSIEGSVLKYQVEREAGQLPVYRAVLWQPESLSIAPVPNDIGAQIEVQRAIQKQIKPDIQEETSKYKQLTNKFLQK